MQHIEIDSTSDAFPFFLSGGTNFGFMNGALVIPWIRKFSYQAVVTSYGNILFWILQF